MIHTLVHPTKSACKGKKVVSFSSALCLTALFVGIGGPVNVHAQGGARVLEEVVVTATRREENVQTIPASITAVTAQNLEDRGITNFEDISKVAAGLYLEQLTNLTNVSLRIRGVGTGGNSAATPSVGVLVDGVYQLRQGAAFTEMLDVSRVEVLRGPQGTLFGKNTTAGVIHIHTQDPDPTAFSSRVQGVVGNLGTKELRGLVNIPLIPDELAVRISGYSAERDGHSDNLFVDEDTRNVDRGGGRVKLRFTPTEDLEIKLSGEKLTQKSRMDSALVEYGPAFDSSQPLPPVDFGETQNDVAGRVEDDVERYILHVNLAVPHHTLSTIISKETIETFLLQDFDQGPVQGLSSSSFISRLTNDNTTDARTREFQLTSEWSGPFNYVVGAFKQDEELVSTTTLFIDRFGVVIPRPPTERDITSRAYFANGTVDFADQWSFTLGARYSDDEVAGSNSQFPGPDITFTEWTYSTKLQYQLDPDKMFYLAYDKGFKDGGINREFPSCGGGGRCLSAEEATWDPEFTYNRELGMKSDWMDGRLRVNGAVFYQTYEDFQVTTSIPSAGNSVVSNAAEVESMGIETDFVYLVNQFLSVEGGVAWIQTEYDKYENAPCPTPTSPGCNNLVQDLSGETLDNAPEWTANLGGEYRDMLPWQGNLEWFGRVDLSYRDVTNLSETQSSRSIQEAYTLLGARLGVESLGRWKVALWGKNLTDKEYAVGGGFSNTGLTRTPGLSRTYGLTADWFF